MRLVSAKRAADEAAGRLGPWPREDEVLHRYRLPNDQPGEGWAVITIGEDGSFQAMSDWGDYAYWWDAFGPCIRAFLARTNAHYVGQKLAHGRDEYDGDATYAEIETYLRELEDDGGPKSPEWLARERETLGDWSGELRDSHDGFERWCAATDIEESWEFQNRRQPAQLTAFMARVFPRLQAILRAEIGLPEATAEAA